MQASVAMWVRRVVVRGCGVGVLLVRVGFSGLEGWGGRTKVENVAIVAVVVAIWLALWFGGDCCFDGLV